MLTVYHLGISQSERIVWLCEELGIPYKLERFARDSVTFLAPEAYRALHPMGIAPVIRDGDLLLGESGAIMEYILAKYGDGRFTIGVNSPEFPNYLFWLHFANATMMPTEMNAFFAAGLPDDGNSITESTKRRLGRAYAMMEDRLGKANYFGGAEFTAADIIMFFPLTTLRTFTKRDLSAYPNIRAYLKRVGSRPAYLKAMEAGDPGLPLALD